MRLRREVRQQRLGDPRGRLRGVESVVPQNCRPIFPQVQPDTVHRRLIRDAEFRQRPNLELDDPRLIQLVNDYAGRPGKPLRPGIKTARKDDYLPQPAARRLDQEIIEEPRPKRDSVGDRLPVVGRGFVFERDARSQRAVDLDPQGIDEWLRVRIADQGLRPARYQRPDRRHCDSCGSDARREIPAVVFTVRSGRHARFAASVAPPSARAHVDISHAAPYKSREGAPGLSARITNRLECIQDSSDQISVPHKVGPVGNRCQSRCAE